MDKIKKTLIWCWIFIGIFIASAITFVSLYKKYNQKVFLIIAIIATFITIGLLIIQKVIHYAIVRVEHEDEVI